jgi:hypothetical protein
MSVLSEVLVGSSLSLQSFCWKLGNAVSAAWRLSAAGPLSSLDAAFLGSSLSFSFAARLGSDLSVLGRLQAGTGLTSVLRYDRSWSRPLDRENGETPVRLLCG